MKKNKYTLLLLVLFSANFCNNMILSQSAVPHSNYGVWNRGGDSLFNPSNPDFDFILGITVGPEWSDIQDSISTVFDWSEIQKAINQAFNTNQLLALKINVGPQCPDWVYDTVPEVFSTGHKFKSFPYYLDSHYINYYYTLIDSFASFYYSQPQGKQDVLSFIFPQNGATGDEVAYKGTITDPISYSISNTQWTTFRINAWEHWKIAFRDGKSRPIPFLFNDVYPGSAEWNWVKLKIGNDFGIKNANAYSRGHHLTNEREWYENFYDSLVNPQGLELFNRAEMDQSWTNPIYQINTNLGFYWGAISGLNSGLSVWDVTTSALTESATNPSVRESFRFFTKYAGEIVPANSTKAFIALHEGLNSADTVKFPENIYGNAGKPNTSRYTAICNDPYYASHGAQIDDSVHVIAGQVSQRSNQTGYNDAGWEIWPTNYSRFITQINPEKESIGLFRIGGKIDSNSSVYSRFARSFENSTGKDTMFFKLHDDFFSSAAGKVKISIIYYDSILGSTWQLKYDAGNGNFKTAYTDTCKGSNSWKKREIILTDAVMLKNGPKGCDFALVNNDTDDDIFHLIEIEQLGSTLGTSDLDKPEENQFLVYPTLVDEVLNWESDFNIERIRIVDLAGKEILNKEINNSNSINLSGLKQGMYLVNFQGKNIGVNGQRIIKK